MSTFINYLTIDFAFAVYLGVWNSTVPVIVISRYGAVDLGTYEISLAVTAIASMLLLSPIAERMQRSQALVAGGLMISMSGVLRFFILSQPNPLALLVCVDAVSAAGFGVVQPLLSVYPAETAVGSMATERGFRIKRISLMLARVTGPLLGAALISAVAGPRTLLVAAAIACLTSALTMLLPKGYRPTVIRQTNFKNKVQELLLGIRLKYSLPPERFFSASDFLLTLILSSALPIVVPNLIELHHLPSNFAGISGTTLFIGSITGILLISPWLSKRARKRAQFIGLWGLAAVSLAVASLLSNRVGMGATFALTGLASACLSFIGVNQRLTSIPPQIRVRMSSATLILNQLASAISFWLSTTLIAHHGLVGFSILCLFSLCVMTIYAYKQKSAWSLLEQEGRDENYYRGRYPELAPLLRS